MVTINTVCFKVLKLNFAHTALFPQIALTGWVLWSRRNVFPYGSHNTQRLFSQTALTGWTL
jgi:hypothetical protein